MGIPERQRETVGDTGLARSAPGLREHRRGRVDPEDGTCLLDLVGECRQESARSTAHVDSGVAGGQIEFGDAPGGLGRALRTREFDGIGKLYDLAGGRKRVT